MTAKSGYKPALGNITTLGGGTSGGSLPKCLAYDASKNSSIGTLLSTAATASGWNQYLDADYFAGIFAFAFYDGTNLTVRISTSLPTLGNTITISDCDATNAGIRVCVVSASLLAICYRDTGTPSFRIRTYSISGTTLTADQNLAVATVTGTAGIADVYGLIRMNGSRLMAWYVNATPRLQVIGINASAGVLTKDGSSTEVVATNFSSLGRSVGISSIATTKAIIGFDVNAGVAQDAIISDSGTSLSVGATNNALQNSAGTNMLVMATANTAMMVDAPSSHWDMSLYTLSSGAINNATRASGNASGQTGFAQTVVPQATNVGHCNGAVLGNVDGTGIDWYAYPCNRQSASSTDLWINFVGISQTGNPPEQAAMYATRLVTSSSYANSRLNSKVIGISSTQFLVIYVDSTASASAYKYLLGNL